MRSAGPEAAARLLGSRVRTAQVVHGGDVAQAHRVELEDGRRVFVKSAAGIDPRTFPAEAGGLAWLAEGELRVPAVLAADAAVLVLELVEKGVPARDADEQLGRGLARLHALGAPRFGLDHDNFLAILPQDNTPEPDWASFLGRRRLEPLFGRVEARGLATPAIRRGRERVLRDLPALVGPEEPPARLHGDLWSGNRIHDERGAPVLVDPAVYGGHREIDLAMMRLFGGFGDAVFEAYEAERPLADGHEARVPLYQLVPLLAHVVLFGGSYVRSVEDALARAV